MALDDDATAGKASTKPKQRKHPPLKSLPVFEGVFSFAVIKCIAQAPSSNCQNFPFLPLRGHAVPLACARNYTRFDSSKICKHARRRKPLRGLRIICGSGLSIRDLESNRPSGPGPVSRPKRRWGVGDRGGGAAGGPSGKSILLQLACSGLLPL